jgi:hypothetical protein
MTTRRADPAFPVGFNKNEDTVVEGMNKREYFAIMLMQGYAIANLEFEDMYQKARTAVTEADVLIEILNE